MPENKPKVGRRLRKGTILGLGLGITLITALLIWQGLGPVYQNFRSAGFLLLTVCFFAPLSWIATSQAWRQLFKREMRLGCLPAFNITAIGFAVNTYLPVMGVGGELLKARLAWKKDIPRLEAIAAGIIDVSLQSILTLLLIAVGFLMLALLTTHESIQQGLFIAVVALTAGIVVFIVLQVSGGVSRLVARLSHRFRADNETTLSEKIGLVEERVRWGYRQWPMLLASFGYRLIRRLLMVLEVVYVAWLMHSPISIAQGFAIIGVVIALRASAFFVPGRLGVQEGGFIAAGKLLGLPADLMLSISLATRLRELLPPLPWFLYWQNRELKSFFKDTE